MEKLLEDFVKNNNPLPPVTKPQPSPKEGIKGCMGDDPMSPYRIPSSQIVFTSIEDIINKKPYSAMFPQSYTPIPAYFLRFGITPYFNPMEYEDFAYGKLTIAGMIDLTCNNQPWVLERDQDFDEIIALTRHYLNQIENLDQNNKMKLQKNRLNMFLKVMYEGRSRMCKRRNLVDTGPKALTKILNKLIRK